MNKLFFILLAFLVFSCNDNQIEKDTIIDESTIQKFDLQSTIERLENIGIRHRILRNANLRDETCSTETQGTCTSYSVDPYNIDVPGANGRPDCTVQVTYDVEYCLEDGVLTSVTITNLDIERLGCFALNTYWSGLSSAERSESISSFEFQVSLMVEKDLVTTLGVTASCDAGEFVKFQYIKNLCYSYCTVYVDKKPTYVKSSCGFICCNRKTEYCINSDGELEQGDPAYITQEGGSCQESTICPGEVPFPNPCTQNKCNFEVNLNDQ